MCTQESPHPPTNNVFVWALRRSFLLPHALAHTDRTTTTTMLQTATMKTPLVHNKSQWVTVIFISYISWHSFSRVGHRGRVCTYDILLSVCTMRIHSRIQAYTSHTHTHRHSFTNIYSHLARCRMQTHALSFFRINTHVTCTRNGEPRTNTHCIQPHVHVRRRRFAVRCLARARLYVIIE